MLLASSDVSQRRYRCVNCNDTLMGKCIICTSENTGFQGCKHGYCSKDECQRAFTTAKASSSSATCSLCVKHKMMQHACNFHTVALTDEFYDPDGHYSLVVMDWVHKQFWLFDSAARHNELVSQRLIESLRRAFSRNGANPSSLVQRSPVSDWPVAYWPYQLKQEDGSNDCLPMSWLAAASFILGVGSAADKGPSTVFELITHGLQQCNNRKLCNLFRAQFQLVLFRCLKTDRSSAPSNPVRLFCFVFFFFWFICFCSYFYWL